VALAVGLLVGLGARQLSRHLDAARLSGKGEVSAAATELGYRAERDFRIDTERASLALNDVLGAEAGAQRLWENAETGNRGIVWASEETKGTGGATCRSLARRTLINGIFRNGAGMACRTGSGPWEQKNGWRAE
jgi:surface antigen